jgi:hypothetical protein
MFMVGQATGNKVLADSALRAVAARSGGNDLLEASVAQSHATDKRAAPTTGALPSGHPSLASQPTASRF